MTKWFKAWKNLGYPIFFNNKYSKPVDLWIIKLIKNSEVINIDNYELYLKKDDQVYMIWIENKFYSYVQRISMQLNSKKEILIFDNFRPSIKTMSKIYNMEKDFINKIKGE